MSTQRKIHHVLASEGEGKAFRYLPVLQAAIDLSKTILITEKVDGSTMQSQLGEPWKRFDRFSKGDPRKRTVSEEERYELRQCEAGDPAVKWYLAAFDAHREAFGRFGQAYPNHWIYFEALGGKIQSRYPDLTPTIRIFDVSENGAFFPFGEAVSIADQFELPVVEHRTEIFFTLGSLLEKLSVANSSDRGFPTHQIEGWVLRQDDGNGNEVVAKIRVADLKKIVR